MADLILPAWINKDKRLKETIQDHAETLKKYADGNYGSIENTARFHRAKDKANQAIKDLVNALETVRDTMSFYVSGDVGNEETRRNRQDRIDWLAEIDANINKEHDFIASNLAGVFNSGMNLYTADTFLMGVNQKLREISVFAEKPTSRPSKYFECHEVITMKIILNGYSLSKQEIDLIIDAMFFYAELQRPDSKTVRTHRKRMEDGRLARGKAPL